MLIFYSKNPFKQFLLNSYLFEGGNIKYLLINILLSIYLKGRVMEREESMCMKILPLLVPSPNVTSQWNAWVLVLPLLLMQPPANVTGELMTAQALGFQPSV